MRSVLYKCAMTWLMLALSVAPLQAFSAPLTIMSKTGCPMYNPQPHQTGAASQQGSLPMQQVDASCPHCVDYSCDDNHCDGRTCFAPVLTTVSGATFVLYLQAATAGYYPTDETSGSLPPSPLYRPPA